MSARRGATIALLAGILTLSAPTTAWAQDPVDLAGAYVLDTVGAIAGDESRVIDALDSLYTRADLQLFVVYVDSFSNPGDPVEWADETAIENGLGANDLLLAVAVTDRQYALSVDNSFPLSNAQLDIVESAIESQLRDDRWADAAIAGAEALEAEATGVVGPTVPTQPDSPSTPSDSGSGGGIPILPIVGGVAVIGVGAYVYSRIRKRGKGGATTTVPDQMTQKQLDQRAGTLLVQLDDSLKTSEQELGFAIAQFGETETKAFTAALASAQQKVRDAFALKQKLDDVTTDSAEQKRQWTTEIIRLCESADAELDSQADAFDELRKLEQTAPQALAATRDAAAEAAKRATTAAATLTTLGKTYADAALAPVAQNVTQAKELLDFAAEAADRADKSLASADSSAAAVAVRAAQASVGQAVQLFDAIDAHAASLAEASTKLSAAIADTRQDVSAARALEADATVASALPTAIAEAEAALENASEDNPVEGLVRVEQANKALDQVFTQVRDEQQRIAHARSQLTGSLTAARAQVASAAEYVSTRRGGIGETARTRLSEASARLASAESLADSDPVAALAEAQRANELASAAFSIARSDVEGFTAQQNWGPTAPRGSQGADLGGLLGEIVGGLLRSGGSSYSGSSGRSSHGSWSSGGSRSGSFGGSSRSSARGSGGGRSRGGRF